jgi:hypothetical protein
MPSTPDSCFLIPILKGTAMSQDSDGFNPFDPTGMLKDMRAANMDSWSKMMIQLVNTDAYAKATGVMLDAWLTTSTPFRKLLDTTMTQVLTNLNLPTRGDVISLAERLTNIEMRLDDLEIKLEEGLRGGRKPSKSQGSAGRNQEPATGENRP